MDDKKNIEKAPQKNLKIFLIKLSSISIAVIIVISFLFNMIFAERLEKIDMLLSLDKSSMRTDFRNKIRNEISKGLDKENMIVDV